MTRGETLPRKPQGELRVYFRRKYPHDSEHQPTRPCWETSMGKDNSNKKDNLVSNSAWFPSLAVRISFDLNIKPVYALS